MSNLALTKDFVNYSFGRTLTLILGTLLALTGCMGTKDAPINDGVSTVRIPVEENGKFKFENVDLQGVKSYETMSGSVVEFVLYPQMGETTITGKTPSFKFSRAASGQQIATDDISLQSAMLYYHFQQFKEMDKNLGLDGVLSYPRKVGLALDKDLKFQNNAYYDAKTDAFIFVPFIGKNLPLLANGGVLAHEHFHSIFSKLVGAKIKKHLAPGGEPAAAYDFIAHEVNEIPLGSDNRESALNENLSSEDRDLYHLVVVRGINEGLADAWAWIYTGNPDFLAMSLPREKEGRTLEKPTNVDLYIDSVAKIKLDVLDTKTERPELRARYLNAVAYNYGTQLSRHLKIAANKLAREKDISDKESRHLLARAILSALPLFQEKFLSLKSNELLETNLIYELIKEEIKK